MLQPDAGTVSACPGDLALRRHLVSSLQMHTRPLPHTRVHRRIGVALMLSIAAALPARADKPATLPDGLWRSRGYGIVLEVRGPSVRAWDVTPVSCIERADTALAFKSPESVAVFPGGRAFSVQTRDLITNFTYDRLDALPPQCSEPAQADANDPVRNFEVLWHAFKQDYAFFRERGVDWDRQYAVFRPMVRPDMSQDELFEVLDAMLAPLDDRHVMLIGPDGRMGNSDWGPVLQPIADAFAAQSSVRDFGKFWRSRLWPYHEATVRKYLGASARKYGPNVVAGRAAPDIGYLFIASMYGYAEGDTATNRAAAVTALNGAFEYLEGVRGLIVDLRLNTGGDDAIALEIAGRLTQVPRPAFTKRARNGDGLTEPQPFTVTPSAEHGFSAPVVVLISNVTTSAAENLAMILKTFPHVVLVGERTASVHSDTLPKRLPNGWTVTISNEIFENSDGIVYEGIGVPPSVEAPYFTPDALAGTLDQGMETALKLLRTQK